MAFLTPAEFAALLRIQRDTVYRLIEAGEIEARRIGRQWRIPRSEVERFTNERKVAS